LASQDGSKEGIRYGEWKEPRFSMVMMVFRFLAWTPRVIMVVSSTNWRMVMSKVGKDIK
jgi:hypothetical protein